MCEAWFSSVTTSITETEPEDGERTTAFGPVPRQWGGVVSQVRGAGTSRRACSGLDSQDVMLGSFALVIGG